MDEIKELDFKYWVVKKEDVDALPCDSDRALFSQILDSVREHQVKRGKEPNPRYLVLDLDDEIDIFDLIGRLIELDNSVYNSLKIRDIAVDLANAILKAKQERS